MPDRAENIARFRALPEQLAGIVGGLTPGQLTTVSIPGEWTVAQIVHHLADAHMNALLRFKLALTEDNPALPSITSAWAALPDAGVPDLEPSLTMLRGLHARLAGLLEALDETQWARTGVHPARGRMTIDDLLALYADHGDDHIAQIQKVLGAM